jgi:hypothetical protein
MQVVLDDAARQRQTAWLFTGVAGHWFEMARTQVGVGAFEAGRHRVAEIAYRSPHSK